MLTNPVKTFDIRAAQVAIVFLLIILGCQLSQALNAKAQAPVSSIPQDRPAIENYDAKR